MTERSSKHCYAWVVLLAAVTVAHLTGCGVSSTSPLVPEEPAQKNTVPKVPTQMPEDSAEATDAQYAPLDGLASGSQEAQERQRQAVQQLRLPLEVKTVKTGIVFRLVPAGTFTMGSSKAEHDAMLKAGDPRAATAYRRQHRVTLTTAFYCGKFEVTQGQWEHVMGTKPSYFKNAGKDAPVERVSWDDCQAFAKKLCQMEGVPEGTYRLLTEAEWEYACRAGTQTALYNGDLAIKGKANGPALDPIAWYAGNSGVDYEGAYDSSGWPEKQYDHKRAGTHPVGGKRANGFGLCDMIGNVYEWCQDWYGRYPSGAATDPLGPPSGGYRVDRGGSWDDYAWACRSASRFGLTPSYHLNNDLGLRLARTIPSSPQ